MLSLSFCKDKHQLSEVYQVTSDDKNLLLSNGVLLYNNIPFTGKIAHYDAVNQTHNISEYVLGSKEGIEIKKYKNNQIAEERFYKKGLKIGVHRGFWRDGKLKFEYHYNTNGMYHGSFREWYSNGQMVKDFNYRKGKENGSQKMWRYDGKIRANYVVKDGERFGLIGLKKCYTITANEEL